MTSPHTPEVEAIIDELANKIDDTCKEWWLENLTTPHLEAIQNLIRTTLTTLHTQHAAERVAVRKDTIEEIVRVAEGTARYQPNVGGGCDCCGSWPEMEEAIDGEWINRADLITLLATKTE